MSDIRQFPAKSRKTGIVERPLEVTEDGKVWRLFTCNYTDHIGVRFTFEIYALDADDAVLRMAALRKSAAVDGELYGVYPA